ncbi:hypothetical protein JOY44_11340 [Phormidium sp. CLA17]|uniref:hypothetical protein n=1 Tax=Leptolyngbya sp. Cla-17 TaxID=2803751 RepID=UPI0017C55F02|nr:hypothetical protein [Leptolyngbya sp. Cla-17]MBM0742207.1 hypothetical protein [Leptolyngbya sp. Cla-17]
MNLYCAKRLLQTAPSQRMSQQQLAQLAQTGNANVTAIADLAVFDRRVLKIRWWGCNRTTGIISMIRYLR